MTTAIIDGALFAAHQAGALGHDIGTLSEWRDALLALRAQGSIDPDGLAHELWAMAQGSAPIVDRVAPMAERLREFAAAARARALEDAALACDKRQFEYGECPETASYCAAAIRALK